MKRSTLYALILGSLLTPAAIAQDQPAAFAQDRPEAAAQDQPAAAAEQGRHNIAIASLPPAAYSIYDAWEASPFRTGQLEGNIAITPNPQQADAPAVLGIQRSRYGSNLFGARIRLEKPIQLSPTPQYVSTTILKPMPGRVMLIGLGKRRERTGQSPEAEQFWVFSDAPVQTGTWSQAVFPIKGASGIDIHALVIIPDCEDRSQLHEDFACYIGDITISPTPPTQRNAHTEAGEKRQHGTGHISASQRNGDITTLDGQVLDGQSIAALTAGGKPLTIRMKPERGFTFSGLRLRHGHHLEGEPIVDGIRQYTDVTFQKSDFHDDTLTIPSHLLDGDILVEGFFVEVK